MDRRDEAGERFLGPQTEANDSEAGLAAGNHCIECGQSLTGRRESLTRNRYRFSHVYRSRSSDRVEFRLEIAERTGAFLWLPAGAFQALIEDLGMHPANPELTEYESAPIGERTKG